MTSKLKGVLALVAAESVKAAVAAAAVLVAAPAAVLATYLDAEVAVVVAEPAAAEPAAVAAAGTAAAGTALVTATAAAAAAAATTIEVKVMTSALAISENVGNMGTLMALMVEAAAESDPFRQQFQLGHLVEMKNAVVEVAAIDLGGVLNGDGTPS